jgi:hypothetical protein
VEVEQSTLRGVDSECAGRGMQPRKDRSEEADVVKTAEGNTEGTVKAWCSSSSGVGEQGMDTEGSPRNLGGPVISVPYSR